MASRAGYYPVFTTDLEYCTMYTAVRLIVSCMYNVSIGSLDARAALIMSKEVHCLLIC
jgi:hypothetical protein